MVKLSFFYLNLHKFALEFDESYLLEIDIDYILFLTSIRWASFALNHRAVIAISLLSIE